MINQETIIVLDFGSQYTQLIARHIREQTVYCEIHPYHLSIEKLRSINPKGIVFSGGPASVYADSSPLPDQRIFELGIPILGICYGMQLITFLSKNGKVHPASKREFGSSNISINQEIELFSGLPRNFQVWMSHGDRIDTLPDGFKTIAHTHNSPTAAMADLTRNFYGLQFHPEVVHTQDNNLILSNFVHKICGCQDNWTMSSFISEAINQIKSSTRGERVLCAVSGGVDSTVLATLLKKAIGDQLVCIFVNNGFLRKGEPDQVMQTFNQLNIKVNYVDATDRFLTSIDKISDPELKRKRIGNTFIEVFTDELETVGQIDFLAQGTLYPDVIESVSTKGPSATIKTHHNVGGLPDNLSFNLVEPLRELFKDEVRKVGNELNIPASALGRHPFPGPGLAIRILGEVTRESLDILRAVDKIFIDEIRQANLYDEIWQALSVLLPVKSVGVMGDERTYENVAALRAVTSTDGMTADWARIPQDILANISNRIINEVRGINRVVYDISSKPPSTIEWE